MTAVTYHRPPNRLGKLISQPGGRRLKEALAQAEANLQSIHGAVASEVDAAIGRLRTAAETAPADAEARGLVYADAASIAGLAGLCGMGRLGQVAYNLCELVDAYIEYDAWNAQAVAAHLDTMALLRTEAAEDPAVAEALFAGLEALVKRAAARLPQEAPSEA